MIRRLKLTYRLRLWISLAIYSTILALPLIAFIDGLNRISCYSTKYWSLVNTLYMLWDML